MEIKNYKSSKETLIPVNSYFDSLVIYFIPESGTFGILVNNCLKRTKTLEDAKEYAKNYHRIKNSKIR